MTACVIEQVLLRVRPELSDDAFLAAAEAANAFLKGCKGFVRRRLAKAADGQWLDEVEWRSMEEALAAAKAFNASPTTKAFNEAIAPGSVVMRHFTIRAATG